MPKLRVLSGNQVVEILLAFGFEIEKQRGSHVKLSRHSGLGKEVLGVPLHKELAKGTLRAIFNQARQYLPEEELKKHFYND